MNSHKQKPIFILAIILSLIGLGLASNLARASHVNPIFISGNATCAQLLPGTTELKIEPVADETYNDGTLTVTIDVRDTAEGQVVDFTPLIWVSMRSLSKGAGWKSLYIYMLLRSLQTRGYMLWSIRRTTLMASATFSATTF